MLDALTIHGGFMVLGWGFLLPLGVLSSQFLRHRDPMWFWLHRAANGTTVVLTVIAIIVAFSNFGNVFVDDAPSAPGYRHGALGMSVLVLSLLNVLSGLLRPPTYKPRMMWQILHKGMGYLIALCAYINMYLGAQLAGSQKGSYIGLWVASLVYATLIIIVMMVDKKRNGGGGDSAEVDDIEPQPNPRPPKAPVIV